MVIRPAVAGDEEGIARVHVDTWRTTYAGLMPDEVLSRLSYEKRAAGWARLFAAPPPGWQAFVAEDAGKIAGFVSVGPAEERSRPFEAELFSLYVREARQRGGIGRKLFETAVSWLVARGSKSMMLWVLAGNPAERFYARMGGRRFAERIDDSDGVPLKEWGYGWDDLVSLVAGSVTGH